MKTILLAVILAGVVLAQDTSLTMDNLSWFQSSESFQTVSCEITNHLKVPITYSYVTFDFYLADGTKTGERLASMETVAAGQRVLYSYQLFVGGELPPFEYVKIGKLEANIEGQRYVLPPTQDIADLKVWSPYVMQARALGQAAADRAAAEERKKAAKLKKKAERDAAKHTKPLLAIQH